jgi:ribosomal protein L13E
MYFVLQYNTKVRLGRGFSLTELKVSVRTMLFTYAIERAM